MSYKAVSYNAFLCRSSSIKGGGAKNPKTSLASVSNISRMHVLAYVSSAKKNNQCKCDFLI